MLSGCGGRGVPSTSGRTHHKEVWGRRDEECGLRQLDLEDSRGVL